MRPFALITCLLLSLLATAQEGDTRSSLATVAILPFTTHGYAEPQAPDAVSAPFSKVLNAHHDLYVIPTGITNEMVAELELDGSQTLLYDQALALACHSGARIFVTGTVLKSKRSTYLIARIIGVDSGRVTGCSVRSNESLDALAAELGKKVAETIDANRAELLGPQDLTTRQEELLARKMKQGAEVTALKIELSQPDVTNQLAAIASASGITVADSGDTVTGSIAYETIGPKEGMVLVKARLTYRIVDGKGEEVIGGPIVSIARGADEKDARVTARDDVLFRVIDQLVPRMPE